MFANLDAAKMQQGLQATMDAGLDPAAIVARFQQSPSLATAMQNPRVMAALMDMARWVAWAALRAERQIEGSAAES
jgi:hypothetical protein